MINIEHDVSQAVRDYLNEHHDESLLWDKAMRRAVDDALRYVLGLANEQAIRSAQTAAHGVASLDDIELAEEDRVVALKLQDIMDVVVRYGRCRLDGGHTVLPVPRKDRT